METLLQASIAQLGWANVAGSFAVLALAGFMSGLSGFGFSAVGAAVLWFLKPAQALPLLMLLSVVNQLLSLGELRRDLLPRAQWWSHGPAPYILGGVAGAPIGIAILRNISAEMLSFAIGLILVSYALWTLYRPGTWKLQDPHRAWTVLVGFCGGVIGGFTAFPGCAVVVWANLRGLAKREQRAIVQPYIVCMQLLSIAILYASKAEDTRADPFDANFCLLFLLMLPAVLPMTSVGVWAFRRVSDVDFRRVTLGLLGISGAGLTLKSSIPLALGLGALLHRF